MAQIRLYNEEELIKLIANSDELAFCKIFNHYRNKLYSYVLRITENEELAEEIVLDAFLKIWLNRTMLSDINRFDSYLYTVVRNQAFNSVKRIAHEASLIKELSLTATEYNYATEETVVHNDYQELLDKAVNQLPPQQKLIYTLSRDEGMKYDEIAFQLKLSKNTVKAHLKKSGKQLTYYFYKLPGAIASFICF